MSWSAIPTPPAFDGEEDRNGRRNHDEIRFWVDYVSTQVHRIFTTIMASMAD